MSRTRPLIAIVDDEASVRKALRRLCHASGMDAETFESAHHLLESLRLRLPDCVILDVHMPGMGGLDASAQIAQRGLRVPSIMITGRDDAETRERSFALGARAYFCKPVDADLLLGAIAEAVARAPRAEGNSERRAASGERR